MNWKIILQSMTAAALGGAASGAATVLSGGHTKGIGVSAAAGALAAVAGLLTPSPIKSADK